MSAPGRALKRSGTIVRPVTERRNRPRDDWSPAWVSATLLLVGSAIPLPGRYNPEFGPYGPDKLLHVVGHAGLVAVLGTAVDGDDRSVRRAVGAIALSSGYGLAIELLQESVPGREFERGDLVAGLLGSLVGLLAWRRLPS